MKTGRYRITPVVIVIVAITSVLIPKLGSGARWEKSMDVYSGTCRANWWAMLLYVQNFVSSSEEKMVRILLFE